MVSKRNNIKNKKKRFRKTIKQKGGMPTLAKQQKEIGTLLLTKAELGKTDECRTILELGVDGVEIDVDFQVPPIKKTALIGASTCGRVDTMKMLLEKGANVNIKDKRGNTAHIYACLMNIPSEALSILLENEADVNAQNIHNETALMIASEKGDTEKVSILLDKGADINLENDDNKTALMLAYNDEIKSLIEKKQEGAGKRKIRSKRKFKKYYNNMK